MRLVQMGIWKPVSITFYNTARIDDYYVKQTSVTAQKAEIDNQIEVFRYRKNPQSPNGNRIRTERRREKNHQPGNQPRSRQKPHQHTAGDCQSRTVDAYRLGKQHLYDFTAKIIHDNQTIAEKRNKSVCGKYDWFTNPTNTARNFISK